MSNGGWNGCRGGKSCDCFEVPAPAPVASTETETQDPRGWSVPSLVVAAVLGLALLGYLTTLVFPQSNPDTHSQRVTVCDASEAWAAPKPDTYKFETSEGDDFTMVHPDGAQVEKYKVYTFEWTDGEYLSSFKEETDAKPDRCK